jgi:WD40 repeat protein
MGTAGTEVRAWDLATGKELPSLGGHERQAHSVTVSRDSRTILTGGSDPFVLVWDWPAGKLRQKIDLGIGKSLDRMNVSADGKQAEIVLWGENALRFYDLDTGRELPSLAEAHRGAIHGMEIAPDGKLVSAGGDNTIRVWDLHTGRHLHEIRTEHPVGAMTLALSREGRLVATADINRGVVTVHDRDTGGLVRTIDTGGQSVSWVAFTSEEGLLAVSASRRKPGQGAGEPPFVGFWDIDSGREVRRLAVNAYLLSPDGRLLPTSSRDQVPLWDVTTGRERQGLPHKDVHAIAFSPDGRTLACRDSNGVTLWEIASGKERCRIDGPTDWSDVLCFSPDGRWLARKDDRAIQLCDVLRGCVVHSFTGHDASVTRLAFTPDSRILASSSYDSTVLLWDMTAVTVRQPRPQDRPSGTAVMTAWNELASADAQAAYRALRILLEAPIQSLPLLRERLRPAPAADANQIDRWLAELDSSRFADRERATRELERQEGRAEPALRRLLANAPTAEARRRAEGMLARLHGPIADTEMLRALRAVEALELMGTRDAKELLQEVARGAPESRLTQEAKGSLGRLAKRA